MNWQEIKNMSLLMFFLSNIVNCKKNRVKGMLTNIFLRNFCGLRAACLEPKCSRLASVKPYLNISERYSIKSKS